MPDNLVFAGTPDFALESLRSLVDRGLPPALVLTQPDRPAGRGRQSAQSPVKRYAVEHGIPVLQPASLKDRQVASELAAIEPRALIVVAYGLLLPPAILDLPVQGSINVHASLLPRWRGAAPIEAAILAGDAETGISLMQMDEGLDTGPVYVQARLAIGGDETAGSLHDRLAALGGNLLAERLPDILEGRLRPVPQDDTLATYSGKRRKSDAELDWRRPASELARRVRAFNPVPGAWFELDDELVKCWSAEIAPGAPEPAGTVLSASASGVDVACGEGALRLLEVQRPSRRRIRASELARQKPLTGRRLTVAAAR